MRALREIDRAELGRFKDLVLRTCGFHLENEREASLCTALRERMAALGLGDAGIYFEAMAADPEELARFVEKLTVNETYFMREPGPLKLVAQRLVPDLLAERTGPLRILSAGCSSGEEPYSVAILLRELYGPACETLFTITGVDIDAGAIAAARRAEYGRNSFRGLEPGLLERHFEPAGHGRHRLKDTARTLVAFETFNLLARPFPPALREQDIVLYRNVSIYFPRQVQQDVFAQLAAALKPNGFLIVGAAETMHHDLGVLSLVERDGVFLFHRRPAEPPRERPQARRPAGTAPQRQARSAAVHLEPPAAPGPPADPFGKALELARKRRWSEALHALGEPASRRGLVLEASLFVNGARHDEARTICERLLAEDALCPEACLMLGVIARHEGNDALAHRRFREALYLDAGCWLAHFYLAEDLFLKGDAKRARAGYESALRILGDPRPARRAEPLFPLAYNGGQFMLICRHKLSLLKENA